MSEEKSLFDLYTNCNCKMKYTIRPHGDGYALYYGRCDHMHGYNLINMIEPAWNFDPSHIEKLINMGDTEYKKNPDGGHIAE